MKSLLLLLLLFTLQTTNSVAQEYQQKIHKHFIGRNMDSLDIVIKELERHNPTNKNRYLSYWDAYARYSKSLILGASGLDKDKKAAEKELNKAKNILENIKEKTSEDYALLGMCYNYSISFSNFMKAPFLSSKAKKSAQKAVELDDKNIRAYLVLGINDFYTPKMYGGQEKCEEYFLSSISMEEKTSMNSYDPSWGKSDAYYYLISYYLTNDDKDKAVGKLQDAVKLYPDDKRIKSLIKK